MLGDQNKYLIDAWRGRGAINESVISKEDDLTRFLWATFYKFVFVFFFRLRARTEEEIPNFSKNISPKVVNLTRLYHVLCELNANLDYSPIAVNASTLKHTTNEILAFRRSNEGKFSFLFFLLIL